MDNSSQNGQNGDHEKRRSHSLGRRVGIARASAKLVLFLEALAPVSLLPLSIAASYMAFAWFGLFRLIPYILVKPLAFAFLIAFIWSLKGLLKLRWPEDSTANRRLEEESQLPHRALSALEDKPASSGAFAEALWQEHKRRMERLIGRLSAGSPTPGIAEHDPYALRAIPVIALFVAFGFSWSNQSGRLSDPLSLVPVLQEEAALRADVWITPPLYTRKPPLFLTRGADLAANGPLQIPERSVLTIRLSGADNGTTVSYQPVGGGKAVPLLPDQQKAKTSDAASAPNSSTSGKTFHLPLTTPGTLDVAGHKWSFDIVEDMPPEIAFNGEPKRALNGALEVAFKAKDDYGLQLAEAIIEPADQEKGAILLFPNPEFRLELPHRDATEAKGLTSRDLTENPLSGKKVKITLVAKDAAGHIGKSATKEIILPERHFREPLAAAAAEERQVFSLDERHLGRAITLNEALFIRPEETIPNLTHFLLLKSAGERMQLARSEADLKDTADYLWQIALGIEGGDVANAERKVKNAQQALADALNRNASDAEIRKLTQELRKAMNEFMQALTKQMQNNPNQNQMSSNQQKILRQQDLQKMLDEIQKLAESGSRDEARNLLNQMQRMMNNLQTARPNQNNQRGNSQMRQQMDNLGKLLQDQKKLMDETFSLQQALRDRMQYGDPSDGNDGERLFENQRPEDFPQDFNDNGQPQDQTQQEGKPKDPRDSMTAKELRKALKALKEKQQALENDLKKLQKGLGQLGIKPGEGFKEAGREMGNASGALGNGKGEAALGSQGKAIEALRKGASEMLKQMAQNGQGQGMGSFAPRQQGYDPLGRRQPNAGPDLDNTVKVPDAFDAERARQILEIIRRKLGNNASPELERQYLERLLDLQ